MNVVFLGVGNVARHVARLLEPCDIKYGTTRSADKIDELSKLGIKPIFLNRPLDEPCMESLESACRDACVLVSFPPDRDNEPLIADACKQARRLIYVSSTGVFGGREGVIDDLTCVDEQDENARARLCSERLWLAKNATVLRCPALYAENYGLHRSLLAGKFRLPGDGSSFGSRIHLGDLARIILKTFDVGLEKRCFVVGDLLPASYLEVVQWLCGELEIEMPPSSPLEQVHFTLRANRRIDARAILSQLDLELDFPTYREGFRACLKGEVRRLVDR